MQSSGGTAALNSYGDSEWESSFTQILSRTKQNLNRINQRYSSTSTSLSLPTSSSSLSRTLPSDPIFSADREASGTYNVPSSSFLSDNDRNFLSKGKPSQLMATNLNPLFLLNGRDDAPSTVNNQADQEQKLLERLSEKLLSQLGHGIGPAHVGNREEVDVLRNKVRLLSESNESLERELRGLQSKFSACSGAIESLTAAQRERERERDREKESGRGSVSKLESWARQEEVWREQTEERLNGIAKQLQRSERERKDERELRPDFVTRADLDGFRDRVAVLSQQAASAALSAWHDKFEASLRQVERQVALVRIGASEGSPGGFTSQEQVEAALKHVMPSELLLKGTVAHEVLQLEMKLEERLESRLRNLLSSELTSEDRQLKQRTTIRETILGLGLGLSVGEQTGSVLGAGFSDEELEKVRDAQRMKTSQSQRAAESEMQRLVVRLEALGDRLQSLELSQEADQRNQQVRLTHADRKMEEAITVAQNSLTQVQFRAARLEDQVRDSELALRAQAATLKEDMLDRLRDHISLWSEEKVGIDRRLLVNEKIAEDCLERMKLSTSVMDAYFLTNPEVKRFRKTADNVDSLTQEWKLLQKEVRECSVALTKLQASSCPRSEHLLLRDRVAKIESVTETCIPDLTDSVKKLLESTMTQQSRLDTLDVLTQHSSGNLDRLEERQGRLTDSVGHLQGEATRLGRIAEDNGADINSLKDSAGQMLSRVLSMEGRSTLAGKVCSTENSARMAQLTDLTQQTVQLKNDLAQLSRTVDGVSKDVARAAKDADAALKHALSVPLPVPVPVPVQPAPMYGSPDPKQATKQNIVHGRDLDGGIVVLPNAVSNASPQDDNNKRGHAGRIDFSTVDVSEPDSDLHSEHFVGRNDLHRDSQEEKRDSTSVASFSDDEDDDDDNEVSVSQVDSPVHLRHSDFSQVNVTNSKTQSVGILSSPPQTISEKAVKSNGDSILDFDNSFDESILSVDLDTHHKNPDPKKSVDSDVLQIPTLSEPATSPKSVSDEDSDNASQRESHLNLNPTLPQASTEQFVLPNQTPAEATRTLPSMRKMTTHDESDSDSEIDNSMLSDWDDESSRSRVGNALSSSMSSNVVSIQAASNTSSYSSLPHLDRQEQEQESRVQESAREAAETRSMDANIGQDDPPVAIHSHSEKAINNDQTQVQQHSLQLEEPTTSLPAAVVVKADPPHKPEPLTVDEKHQATPIVNEVVVSSYSSSSSAAAAAAAVVVDPVVRSSLTVDTSSFASSSALNTSVPSSRATSPGKSSSAATPSAALSIKERLRLRQEAMKLQKAQTTAVASLSANSDHGSGGSVPTPSKPLQIETQDKGKDKSTELKQGDEVMAFEEFDD